MKRTIACLMVAVMLLVSLMGCAGKEAASDDSQGSPVTSAEERETLNKMVEKLEEFDDVQTVYTNMKPEGE